MGGRPAAIAFRHPPGSSQHMAPRKPAVPPSPLAEKDLKIPSPGGRGKGEGEGRARHRRLIFLKEPTSSRPSPPLGRGQGEGAVVGAMQSALLLSVRVALTHLMENSTVPLSPSVRRSVRFGFSLCSVLRIHCAFYKLHGCPANSRSQTLVRTPIRIGKTKSRSTRAMKITREGL